MKKTKTGAVEIDFNEVEERIISKIAHIKEAMHDDDQLATEQHFLQKPSPASAPPKYDKSLCYYQEFWKLYLINEIVINKIKQYSLSNQTITEQIHELDENIKVWTSLFEGRVKKKVRRPAAQIPKNYLCPFPHCEKSYGTDVSLNLHMKLKHNSGTKTERETIALEIIMAEDKGENIQPKIAFPPGYLEHFRANHKKQPS